MAIRRLKVGNGTITGVKRRRRGIHAKTKCACNKFSKNWIKPYIGQGR